MKQPADYIDASERTSPADGSQTNDLPPAWLGYLILGLFVGFLLGTSISLFF